MTVGKSSRTPFKHWVLNAELGRLCGIFSNPIASKKVHAKANPFHVIDLCAGDGESTEDGQSSPQIICRHIYEARKRNVHVKATLIEIAANTFECLHRNTAIHLSTLNDEPTPTSGNDWIEMIHGDAKEYRLIANHKYQAVFIHADPNSIADWPVTKHLIESLSETTTMLATLGCNVGGLKRRPAEERLEWYKHVSDIVQDMPRYHDAILIRLERDKSQWAYLLRLPRKWVNRTVASISSAGKRYSPFDLELASFRDQRSQFLAMEDYLFLTETERSE